MDTHKKKTVSLSDAFTFALCLLAVVTLITQILRCGMGITQTENSLFGVLQFIFAVSFAWMLSRSSSKADFENSQKQFAIAAYRRIQEIEMATSRLFERIQKRRIKCSSDMDHELDAIQEVTASIQATSRSSISDWADIIGDEIATINKLERLRNNQLASSRQVELAHTGTSEAVSMVHELRKNMEEWQKKVDDLHEKLPASLQVTERTKGSEVSSRMSAEILLLQEFEDHGSVVLDAFWGPNDEFDNDIRSCDLDEEFSLMFASVGTRTYALIMCDRNKNTIGVLTNKYSASSDYMEFASIMYEFIATKEPEVSVHSIRPQEEDGKRVYFKVTLTPKEE